MVTRDGFLDFVDNTRHDELLLIFFVDKIVCFVGYMMIVVGYVVV